MLGVDGVLVGLKLQYYIGLIGLIRLIEKSSRLFFCCLKGGCWVMSVGCWVMSVGC